jgi:RimJ/RimL family protein N-acetyltransferase
MLSKVPAREVSAVLRANDLELRAVERDDLRTIWKWFNDVEVGLPAGNDIRPISFAELEARFEKELQDDSVTRFSIVVDGTLIGRCGLFDWDDALSLSLAIAIGEQTYWGKGYGTTAIRLLLDYAFVHRNAHRVWLEVAADNERAIRAYRRCGFIAEGRMRDNAWDDGRYVDELMMAILRPEWEELRTRESQPTLFTESA